MKCDDFLRSSTTGGAAPRWLARLHAFRCRRCAAARDRLAEMKVEMSQAQSLTARERNLWESACTARPREMATPATALRLVGFVMAAVLLLTAGWFFLPRDRAQPVAVRVAEPTIATGSPARQYTPAELAGIESGLNRLSADLDRLDGLAELLEARRDLRQLVQAYPPLTVPSQTSTAPPRRRSRQKASDVGRPSSG